MPLSTEDIQRLRAFLLDRAAIPGIPLTGALAGNICRSALGRSLRDYAGVGVRDFIEQHVPELVQVGRAGDSDPVYGFAQNFAIQPNTKAIPDASLTTPTKDTLWRTWVSPGTRNSIAINVEDGAARILGPDEHLATGEIRISPAPRSAHVKIARDFLHQVPEPLRTDLESILVSTEGNPQWWQTWSDHIRSSSAELYRTWGRWRADHLQKLIEETVASMPELQTVGAHVVDQIVSDRPTDAGRKRSALRQNPPLRTSPQVSSLTLGPAASTHRIVGFVVERMAESELRQLSLPVGLLLDAVKALRST